MNKILTRFIDWLMGPNPRTHLLVIRNDGKVIMRINFRTLMAMNELNGRQGLIVDLDGNCKITLNDNLSWMIEHKEKQGVPFQS